MTFTLMIKRMPFLAVTSMARLLGGPIDVGQVKEPLVECMADVFGFDSVGKASPQDI